jgi:hypothetical protein
LSLGVYIEFMLNNAGLPKTEQMILNEQLPREMIILILTQALFGDANIDTLDAKDQSNLEETARQIMDSDDRLNALNKVLEGTTDDDDLKST